MPHMGWLVHQGKSDLFVQFPLQGLQWRLGRLDSSTGRSPDDHALSWQVELAQEYAIPVIQDDRSNRGPEVGMGHGRRLPVSITNASGCRGRVPATSARASGEGPVSGWV